MKCFFVSLLDSYHFSRQSLHLVFKNLDLSALNNTHAKMAPLKAFLKEKLALKTIEDLGSSGGGCISNSRHYSTDIGSLFVKTYDQEKVSRLQFHGKI